MNKLSLITVSWRVAAFICYASDRLFHLEGVDSNPVFTVVTYTSHEYQRFGTLRELLTGCEATNNVLPPSEGHETVWNVHINEDDNDGVCI